MVALYSAALSPQHILNVDDCPEIAYQSFAPVCIPLEVHDLDIYWPSSG